MMTTKCTWRARSNTSEVKRAEAPFVCIRSSGMYTLGLQLSPGMVRVNPLNPKARGWPGGRGP